MRKTDNGGILMGFFYLTSAIISEVFGSTMMKMSTMTHNKLPILGIVIGYILSFYLLSLTLVSIPLSFSYAVWSGVGTALTAIVGFFLFKEPFNWKIAGSIGLLIFGIVLMRL